MITPPPNKKVKQVSWWLKILTTILSGAAIYLTITFTVKICSNNKVKISNPIPKKIDKPIPEKINLCNCPETWNEIPCEGEDSLGHKAKFVIAILTEEEKWDYGSDTTLEKSGNFRKNFKIYLKSLPYIQENSGFICVGTASKDGSKSSQHDLAGSRAEEIIYSVRPFSTKHNDIFKLNLGKYSTSEKDISDQRRVIVIGILKKDLSMDEASIKKACYNALKEQLKSAIKLDIDNYSHFEFTSVKN